MRSSFPTTSKLMTNHSWTNLTTAFAAKADPQRAAQQKAYMRGQFAFYGLDSKIRRDIQNPFVKEALALPDRDLKPGAGPGWADPHRGCQLTVVDVLIKRARKMDKSYFDLIDELIVTKSWWDTVDFLSGTILGVLFKKFPEEIAPRTGRLIHTDNMWENRSAILFQLKYKSKMDVDLLEHFITIKQHDHEFFVQKAIGWMLRTLSKFDPDSVKTILARHPELSGLAKREASKYL